MRAGLLNERIEIYRIFKIKEKQFGSEVEGWDKVHTTRARILYTKNNREVQNNEVRFDNYLDIIIRIHVDLQDMDRVKWNKKYYRVISILPKRDTQEKQVTLQLIDE